MVNQKNNDLVTETFAFMSKASGQVYVSAIAH